MKMPQTKTLRTPRHRTCAVEMHIHPKRTPLWTRELHEKCRGHPDLSLAFNTYRKNPSVWTRCLGNEDDEDDDDDDDDEDDNI